MESKLQGQNRLSMTLICIQSYHHITNRKFPTFCSHCFFFSRILFPLRAYCTSQVIMEQYFKQRFHNQKGFVLHRSHVKQHEPLHFVLGQYCLLDVNPMNITLGQSQVKCSLIACKLQTVFTATSNFKLWGENVKRYRRKAL